MCDVTIYTIYREMLKNNSFEFSCLLRVTRENDQGLNTKMIPRSFETAASFITRRLIQYHASLIRISTVLFTQDTRRLTYEKVSRRMNGAAPLLSELLLLLFLLPLLPSLLLESRRQVRAITWVRSRPDTRRHI